jgi:hypothetical protein
MRTFSMAVSVVVAMTGFSMMGAGCGSDPVDSGATSDITSSDNTSSDITSSDNTSSDNTSTGSISNELLIEPTVDLGASGRPVVLWFWAPG